MLNQQNPGTTNKTSSKLLDQEKIKSLLSKKLENRISNPQQMLKQLDDQLLYHIYKTEQQITRQLQRQQKIRKVQQQQLKSRSLLNQKIHSKIQKSSKKKQALQKEKLENIIKARKLKEQLIQNRKKQIKENDFKERFQRFKQYKSQNNLYNAVQQQKQKKLDSLMPPKLSYVYHHIRMDIEQPLMKSKQLNEIKYFKIMQKINKKKVYDKLQRKTNVFRSLDKSEHIEKIQKYEQNKFIQKLGQDLQKIQEARIKKEKAIKDKIEKAQNQIKLEEEQRMYRLQILKQNNMEKLKTHRESINKKHEKFFTMKNKSTLQLRRNLSQRSGISGSNDYNNYNQKLSPNNMSLTKSNLSKTVENFQLLISLDQIKANRYLQEQKEKKLKNQIRKTMSQVMKEQKIDILYKNGLESK